MNDKNEVILIGPNPPPMGGIAKYCDDIRNSYLNEKYSIKFFDITIPLKYRPQALTKKTNSNIIIRDGIFNVISQVILVVKKFITFGKISRGKNIRIIHIISCTGLGFWRNAVFIIISKLRKKKIIFHVVGEIDVFFKCASSIKKKLITKTLNASDCIIVQSEGLRKITQEMTVSQVTAIYNGVDIHSFSVNTKRQQKNKKITLITVGALGQRKGYFDLIEIAKYFKEYKIRNIIFRFVGGGQVEKFKDIIDDQGLGDLIKIEGQVSETEKIQLLFNSDIFILPTYAEGQPIAILEALAAGLPVISTNVGSIPEVIGSENGFILNPGDLDGIKETIEKLIVSESLRIQISNYNSKYAASNFTLDRVFSEIDQVYKGCVES